MVRMARGVGLVADLPSGPRRRQFELMAGLLGRGHLGDGGELPPLALREPTGAVTRADRGGGYLADRQQ